ncbi:MAG: hypothetical protein AB7O98_17615 [Hyphomonadaceae bacterium]
MKRMLTMIASLAVLMPMTATAQERMSDARYISAARCLAYADLPQLSDDPANFSALRTAMSEGYRSRVVVSDAEENARRVRVTARSLGESERGVRSLREQRTEACASFVERGFVQMGSGTPAS